MFGPEYFRRVGWIFDGYVVCVRCVEQDGEPLECYNCGRRTVEGAEDAVRDGYVDTATGECRAPDEQGLGGVCRGLLYPVDMSDERGEPLHASDEWDSQYGVSCDNCFDVIFEGSDDDEAE